VSPRPTILGQFTKTTIPDLADGTLHCYISDTDLLKGSRTLFAFQNRRDPIQQVEGTQIHIRRFIFSHLFDIINVTQVRGTPASGKTSLAFLLRKYITENHPEKKEVFLACYRVEPAQKPIMDCQDWLVDQGWDSPSNGVLILDEAQLSYWDSSFWLTFIKSINASTPHMVILFASYGSASRNLLNNSTPLFVQEGQLVGLARGPTGASVGLLLTREEMEGVVRKKFPNHLFDDSLLDYIYSLTSGHVGACYDALTVIKDDKVSPYSSADLEYG
jgi:hypothetical protein